MSSTAGNKGLVVGISGASGAIFGIRLIQVIKQMKFESHVVISKAAEKVIRNETTISMDEIKSMADNFYENDHLEAPLASGSFKTMGMVIIPCSMKTLSAIANGYSDNLIARAADVTLKEKRKLVLVPRETPLNIIHLRNMERTATAGAVILPPSPAFYTDPKSVEDIVNFVVGKVLDCFDVEHELYKRWNP